MGKAYGTQGPSGAQQPLEAHTKKGPPKGAPPDFAAMGMPPPVGSPGSWHPTHMQPHADAGGAVRGAASGRVRSCAGGPDGREAGNASPGLCAGLALLVARAWRAWGAGGGQAWTWDGFDDLLLVGFPMRPGPLELWPQERGCVCLVEHGSALAALGSIYACSAFPGPPLNCFCSPSLPPARARHTSRACPDPRPNPLSVLPFALPARHSRPTLIVPVACVDPPSVLLSFLPTLPMPAVILLLNNTFPTAPVSPLFCVPPTVPSFCSSPTFLNVSALVMCVCRPCSAARCSYRPKHGPRPLSA